MSILDEYQVERKISRNQERRSQRRFLGTMAILFICASGLCGLPLDGFVLLTERKLFDEVVSPSFDDMFPGLRYTVHHHDQELSTS